MMATLKRDVSANDDIVVADEIDTNIVHCDGHEDYRFALLTVHGASGAGCRIALTPEHVSALKDVLAQVEDRLI